MINPYFTFLFALPSTWPHLRCDVGLDERIIVYYYNGAQCYEQLVQVCRLDPALILLGLALCLPSVSVSSVFMVMYVFKIFVVAFFTLPISDLSLVGLAIDLVD